jgi:histidine kinase
VCLRRIKEGGEAAFELGQQDDARIFRFPQALYGRDEELAQLLHCFEEAAAGRPQLVLVAGYSGVGKTALVHEVHKPITARRGMFVSGKNDQLRRNVPYHALTQAMASLVRHVLTEPADVVARWKAQVIADVGDALGLLVEICPELRHLVGPQTMERAPNPADVEALLQGAFRSFIATFARADHPLVLFIDDLQWSDRGALLILEKLVTSGVASHLMLVGAYRDNEVDDGHPLTLSVDRLRKAGAPMHTIEVLPLLSPSVQQLVVDTTGCAAGDGAALTALLIEKTRGNPFFLRQFLETLHDDGLLTWDADGRCWTWEMDAIRSMASTDNVVAFMLGKLQRLPEATQDALKVAGSIGATFDLEGLALVTRTQASPLGRALEEAVRAGHLIAVDDHAEDTDGDEERGSYRFVHDRVQQAAYELIPQEERPALHLTIGRLLLAGSVGEALEERLFDIVGHMNQGASLIADGNEKARLLDLNLAAARRALGSSAYQTAAACTAAGLALLGENAWVSRPAETYELHFMEARCAYQLGDSPRAEAVYDRVLEHTTDPANRAAVYARKSILLRHTARYTEAFDACAAGLALGGFDIPHHSDAEGLTVLLGQLAVELAGELEGRNVMDLAKLPRMTDRMALVQTDVLDELCIAGVFLTPLLIQIGAHRSIQLSLKHGNCGNSCVAYVYYAMGVTAVQGLAERGYEFSQVSLTVARQQQDLRAEAKSGLWAGNYLAPFARDMAESVRVLQDTVDICTRVGAPLWAAYAAFFAPVQIFHSGVSLVEVREGFDHYLPWMEPQSLAALRAYLSALEAWQSPAGGNGDFEDEAFRYVTYLEQTQGLVLAHQHYYFLRLMSYVLFNQLDRAWELLEEAAAAGDIHTILFGQPTAAFWLVHHAVTLSHRAATAADPSDPTRALAAIVDRLETLAISAPATFGAGHGIAAGELARIRGEHTRAMGYYDDAIKAARGSSLTHWEALAAERAARFHQERGRQEMANFYLRTAHDRYVRWGASAKVVALEREFGDRLIVFEDRAESTLNLDLLSVVKASQALAGEIDRERLLEKLMRVVMENLGAERGVLVLARPSGLRVEAQAATSESRVVLDSLPLDRAASLPVSVVQYVERAQESVVLDDATTDAQFSADPYILSAQPRSVLCAPIVHSGKLTGIFYFENNLSTGAFTPDRLEVLTLLSAQVSISMENAELVGNLEGKVRERTHELERANDELRASLEKIRAMQQKIIVQEKLASLGSLTAGIAHELQNPLNFINNFSEGSVELAEEMMEMVGALEPRHEPGAMDELREVVSDLRDASEKIHRHGARAAGIIRGMLGHAGQSSGQLEQCDLNELVDTSINLAMRLAHVDDDVEVIRVFDDGVGSLILAEADIQRVIINLVDNAIYAARMRQGDAKPSVRISTLVDRDNAVVEVQDNGPGIPRDIQDKLFEPFFTTKPAGTGTGLGLSLSYDIVVQGHEGEIDVQSTPGHFTQFSVRLPR